VDTSHVTYECCADIDQATIIASQALRLRSRLTLSITAAGRPYVARWHEAPAATGAAGEGQSSVVEPELGFEPTTDDLDVELRLGARGRSPSASAC
jgi:hypothetical protein